MGTTGSIDQAELIRQLRDAAKRVIDRHQPDHNTGTCRECGRSAVLHCDAPEVMEALSKISYLNDELRGVDRSQVEPYAGSRP